ncbi:MAG: ABC transporter substrate-binding protein [Candidatus Rokubacteria bacterium]|nr:ABC transporter substrate-binding protein [Candidatus Rokubacteria bacterium]
MKRLLSSAGALAGLIGLLVVLNGGAPTWAEDGVTDKEVIIGAGMDLTGAVANWGVNIKAGMEAVFDRVNDAGGVHGRKIKLIAYDHVYQPPKAVTNAKRLVERDKVFVMMGHLGTPTTKAIKEYLEEKQVPNIFPATLASMWTTSGKWHVGDLASYADQTWLIIDYLVNERKIKKIASFYQDDEYGLDGHLAGKARLKQYELAYVAEVDYKRADIDFSSQAAKLKESGAEAVIVQAVYREPPRLAEQCHAIGYYPQFIGPGPIVVNKTIELGGKHVEGLIGVEVYPLPTDPGPFLDLYRADMKKYFPGLPPDTTNLYGYQKAALFVEALQRTGRNLTRDSLLKSIESIKDWDPGWGLKYSYGGDNRRGMSRVGRLVMVKNGKWTKMSQWIELKEGGRR